MFEKKWNVLSLSPIVFLITAQLHAESLKLGEAKYYQSPQNIQEVCLRLSPLAQANYSKKDLEEEARLCAVDFYFDQSSGVCAKTWSTSPGLMIYNLTSSAFDSNKERFETEQCKSGLLKGFKKKAKFKSTMAEDDTSSTYSKASLIYYHLSRYFNTDITVPVAVYREIDSLTHKNLSYEGLKNSKSEAIKNGWKRNTEAHKQGESYYRKNLFFGDTIQTVQGVLLKGSGEMVGPEINGINSEYGSQSNIDFSNTPAFLALKNTKDVDQSITESLATYNLTLEAQFKKHKRGFFKRANHEALEEIDKMKKTLPLISNEQMKLWMKELTEMVILDTLLSQEDRIMNIDFKWITYTQDEKGKFSKQTLEAENNFFDKDKVLKTITTDPSKTALFQQLVLNDNDAAGISYFTNFSKKAKLIELINHIAPETYEKMKSINLDLNSEGEVYQFLKKTLLLSNAEMKNIVDNSHYIFESLATKCEQGVLKFDLLTVEKLISQKRNEEKTSVCR